MSTDDKEEIWKEHLQIGCSPKKKQTLKEIIGIKKGDDSPISPRDEAVVTEAIESFTWRH